MCSAEAAITIMQTKQKTERWTSIQWKGDRALSYNGAKTANRKHSFKISAINGRAKGSKKKRTCGRADGERRKKMIWTFEINCLVPFYFMKIIKKKNYKTLVKKIILRKENIIQGFALKIGTVRWIFIIII